MEQTTLFMSNRSQAVRLPKEFRLNVDEVEISREGDALILRPHKTGKEAWSSLKAALDHGFSEDFFGDGREQPPEQDRPELDNLFK